MDGTGMFDALEEGWRDSLADTKHIPCSMLVTECHCFFISHNFTEWKRMVSGIIHKLSYLTADELVDYDYRDAFDSHVTIGNCALAVLLEQVRCINESES